MMHADVLVVGAGITGLAAADALQRAGRRVKVLEASSRPGGRIRTVSYNGDKAESGGQGIHSNYTEMLRLLDNHGLRGDLLPAPEKSLYIDKKGRPRLSRIKEDLALMTGPRGAGEMLAFRSRYFSRAKSQPQFEIARDIPEYDDVTAAEVFKDYSRAFQDFVLRPLTHAMANTTPEGTNLYYVVNGLNLAFTTEISSLANGNEQLPIRMAKKLDVSYGAAVDHVLCTNGRVDGVALRSGQTLRADHVIITTPARSAGHMLADNFEPARSFLQEFPAVGLALVFFFLDRPIDSPATRFYGHPYRDAQFNMAMNNTRKTPHLAPSGKAIISAWPAFPDTVELLKLSDSEIIERALSDMELFVPKIREWTEYAVVERHDWAVARYPAGSVRKILEFKRYADTLEGISFAGTDYDFLHMEAGILSAYRAVARALEATEK